MLEARLEEKIDEVGRGVFSGSLVTAVEVVETRESSSDAGGGLSTWKCRVSARLLRRTRRSCWNAVSERQILGRNSGSFSSCSLVKNMAALCGVWLVVWVL